MARRKKKASLWHGAGAVHHLRPSQRLPWGQENMSMQSGVMHRICLFFPGYLFKPDYTSVPTESTLPTTHPRSKSHNSPPLLLPYATSSPSWSIKGTTGQQVSLTASAVPLKRCGLPPTLPECSQSPACASSAPAARGRRGTAGRAGACHSPRSCGPPPRRRESPGCRANERPRPPH
jgi:hypothetical protein